MSASTPLSTALTWPLWLQVLQTLRGHQSPVSAVSYPFGWHTFLAPSHRHYNHPASLGPALLGIDERSNRSVARQWGYPRSEDACKWKGCHCLQLYLNRLLPLPGALLLWKISTGDCKLQLDVKAVKGLRNASHVIQLIWMPTSANVRLYTWLHACYLNLLACLLSNLSLSWEACWLSFKQDKLRFGTLPPTPRAGPWCVHSVYTVVCPCLSLAL
jgi:hypothetical protein